VDVINIAADRQKFMNTFITPIGRAVNKQTDRQTDRQTDKQTNREHYKLT